MLTLTRFATQGAVHFKFCLCCGPLPTMRIRASHSPRPHAYKSHSRPICLLLLAARVTGRQAQSLQHQIGERPRTRELAARLRRQDKPTILPGRHGHMVDFTHLCERDSGLYTAHVPRVTVTTRELSRQRVTHAAPTAPLV